MQVQNPMSQFVHLHLHSGFSLLDGACDPDTLTKTAAKYGMPAVAITDHGNLFGAIGFYDAAIKAGVRLCGPIAWRDRADFTCFQAGSEVAAITRGVAAELGPLANTQPKPEVGPFVQPRR